MTKTESKNKKDKLIMSIIQNKKTAAIMLLIGTMIALMWVNGGYYESYHHLLENTISLASPEHTFISLSVHHWINDGLMTIFFLIVGIEIRMELTEGKLNSFKKATLPFIAALGGVIVPAGIYWLLTDGEALKGWAIPTATDIAFALGIVALIGTQVSRGLEAFLLALAIFDDLIACIIIAVFYTANIDFYSLILVFLIFGILKFTEKQKIELAWIYLVGGIAMWYCMYQSGVHATLSGVILAFTLPMVKGDKERFITRVEHFFKPLVDVLILPAFAFANAGILISSNVEIDPVMIGIFAGLVIGKPVGIVSFTLLADKLGFEKPGTIAQLVGLGIIAGIGFTMAIFVTDLAFSHEALKNSAKFAILIAFLVAAIGGYITLKIATNRR